jgi:hypothetical protein
MCWELDFGSNVIRGMDSLAFDGSVFTRFVQQDLKERFQNVLEHAKASTLQQESFIYFLPLIVCFHKQRLDDELLKANFKNVKVSSIQNDSRDTSLIHDSTL